MAWINIIIAGIIEVIWAVSLKYSNGYTIILPSVITVTGMILSYYFLAIAMKELPVGTAYTVWTSIGVIGTIILGIILFKEPAIFSRIFFLLLILTGIIVLKLTYQA